MSSKRSFPHNIKLALPAFFLFVTLGWAGRSRSTNVQSLTASTSKFNGMFWSPLTIPPAEHQKIYAVANVSYPTLVATGRLILTAELAYGALIRDVEGDFVETGVFTGGSTIVLMKMLQQFDSGVAKRKLWACDSFDGLPNASFKDAEDTANGGVTPLRGLFRSTEDTFCQNMKKFGADDPGRLRVLRGWFKDTLATSNIERISFLRLDGDLYDSTMDVLNAIYDRVSPGGIVYVDDYLSFSGCRAAVDEFRQKHGIKSPLMMQAIPEAGYFDENARIEAVWWIKW